jgi:histidine triad (HIT) family protein
MCVFCQIIAGEVPAHIVLDEEGTLAFLDVRPLFPGHTLLVPKRHYETLSDLPPDLIEPFFSTGQRLARAVETAAEGDGSQSVPHLHLHVVPRKFRDGLRGFLWPRKPYPDEGAAEMVAANIRRALADGS